MKSLDDIGFTAILRIKVSPLNVLNPAKVYQLLICNYKTQGSLKPLVAATAAATFG